MHCTNSWAFKHNNSTSRGHWHAKVICHCLFEYPLTSFVRDRAKSIVTPHQLQFLYSRHSRAVATLHTMNGDIDQLITLLLSRSQLNFNSDSSLLRLHSSVTGNSTLNSSNVTYPRRGLPLALLNTVNSWLNCKSLHRSSGHCNVQAHTAGGWMGGRGFYIG